MFTSIISNMLSSTISMDLVGLPDYHNAALVALGLLLSFKYILSGSNCWEEFLESSLNMGIYPLLLSFSWILIYTVLSIL